MSFEQAAQLASNDPNALYDEGLGYQMNQNLGHAQQLYQAAINLNPGLAGAHHNLGTVYTQMGKPEEAFQQYHAAAWQDPTNITFSHDLARSTQAAGATADRIVGTWLVNGGTSRLSGTMYGRQFAQSMPIPAGDRITFTKTGAGSYRLTESVAASQLSTTFELQRDGSYLAPTVNTPEEARVQRQFGGTERGLVTIWVRGDVMFGDSKTTATGRNLVGNSSRTWKATRAASK